MMNECLLVEQWRHLPVDAPPFLLAGDKILQERMPTNQHRSFDEFIQSPDFGLKDDSAQHLGLLPIPYVGNLQRASVFILTLNPGLSPIDYYCQQHNKPFTEALIRNLCQENADDPYPFIFLNPRFSWHSGFDYWHGRLRDIAQMVARKKNKDHRSGLQYLAQKVCVLELVPYHSRSFGLSRSILDSLESVRLMVDYVREVVVPRAQSGEVAVVVTRKAHYWGLTEDGQNVVIYQRSETRGAHLSLNSRGGELIARHLGVLD